MLYCRFELGAGLVETAAGPKQSIDLLTVSPPFLDFVEVAIIGVVRIVRFFGGPSGRARWRGWGIRRHAAILSCRRAERLAQSDDSGLLGADAGDRSLAPRPEQRSGMFDTRRAKGQRAIGYGVRVARVNQRVPTGRSAALARQSLPVHSAAWSVTSTVAWLGRG